MQVLYKILAFGLLLLIIGYFANDKTHIAIWTLGQLRSEKALPVLRNLYKDDPEGNSCYGRHDSVICQYELYKAIRSIEGNTLISFAHLNK
jgi:hypothetical protein